jgi:hypothetical protein
MTDREDEFENALGSLWADKTDSPDIDLKETERCRELIRSYASGRFITLREEVSTLREELNHLRQVVTSISFRLPHFAPPGVVTRRDGEDW